MGKFDAVLLASDFDNTLVYTQGALESGSVTPQLCDRNRQALHYFMEHGGRFLVCTGRALAAYAAYAGDIPCNAPCILSNGAMIYDFQSETLLETSFLSERIYDHMAAVFARFPRLALEIYHDDRRIHTIHPNHYIANHEHLTRSRGEVVAQFSEVELPMIKILFEEDRPLLDELDAFLRAQTWIEEYELIFSGEHLLELTARGANKGDTLLRLAARLGIARENLYGIGDHSNDLSLLQVSAVPFAPANCIPALREAGAQIVSHCADGAVADVIDYLDARY